MARGIKDKVAILGMGCSKFGERWDAGAEELMLEAYKECLKDAGIDQNQLQAALQASCPRNRDNAPIAPPHPAVRQTSQAATPISR